LNVACQTQRDIFVKGRTRYQSALCVSYQGCEEAHNHYDCLESVKHDCRTGEQLYSTECNNDDRKAPIAENEGGHCMCAEGNAELPETKNLGQVTCGLHPDTTCQERCAGTDRGSAISDIVVHARRVSDGQGEDCPEGFREVQPLRVGGNQREPNAYAQRIRDYFDAKESNGLNPINYDNRTINGENVRFTLCVRHADKQVQKSAHVANDFSASEPLQGDS